jgi:hypothetical protein
MDQEHLDLRGLESVLSKIKTCLATHRGRIENGGRTLL